MRVLVYGATGTQGGPVTRRLLERGTAVRAVARTRAAAAALTELGAEAIDANLDDPASVVAATHGVDAVFVQLPAVASAQLVSYARHALTAIAHAGAPHTVLTTSSVVPTAPTGVSYADAKLRIVELTQELTPRAVLLHPGLYLDTMAGPLRPAIEQNVIPFPIPADVPVSWLSADDAAKFAIAALDRPELAGRRLPLGGIDTLSGPQLADRFATVLGHPVRYEPIPPAAFGAQLAQFLGEEAGHELGEFYEWTGTAGIGQLAPDLTATMTALPVKPVAVTDWARTALRNAQ